MRCLTFFRGFSQFRNLKLCLEKDSSQLTKCSLPQKLFISPRKYGQDLEAGKTYPDTGSGSATLIIAICLKFSFFFSLCWNVHGDFFFVL
jgi:hypothetical protein